MVSRERDLNINIRQISNSSLSGLLSLLASPSIKLVRHGFEIFWKRPWWLWTRASVEPRGNLSCCHWLRLRSHSQSQSQSLVLVVVAEVVVAVAVAVAVVVVVVTVATATTREPEGLTVQMRDWTPVLPCILPVPEDASSPWGVLPEGIRSKSHTQLGS